MNQQIRCPICGLPVARVRPAFPGETPQHPGLPVGFDCPNLHALVTADPEYREANLQRKIDEIHSLLDELTFEGCTHTDWELRDVDTDRCTHCGALRPRFTFDAG